MTDWQLWCRYIEIVDRHNRAWALAWLRVVLPAIVLALIGWGAVLVCVVYR